MRVRLTGLAGLCLAALLAMVLVFPASAQNKKADTRNFQGQVQSVKKDTSIIMVNDGKIPRQVMYGGETKFMYGHSDDNKPGTLDQVKDGYYISCSGAINAKSQLVAKECVYRETK